MENNKGIYDVKVHAYDDEMDENSKCEHELCLFIEDVSSEYQSDLENNVYTCVCLECGLHSDYKISKNALNRIVNIDKDSMTALLSFYDVRKKYLELKQLSLPTDEIANAIASYYQEDERKR
jgi:hypothetical protein